MNNAKVSYVAVNDSRLVAGGKLEIGSAVVGLDEFDFGEFGSIQRKVVVGWLGEERARYSSAVRAREISSKEISIVVESDGPVVLDLGCEKLLLDVLDEQRQARTSYKLFVKISLEVPLEAFGEVPDHVKPLVQYSEILHVTISLSGGDVGTHIESSSNRPVYDGYGELGFFLADLDKMHEYIISRLVNGVINLKDAFCQTEIANELFSEGLLVLIWGMTPWHYYLYGSSEPEDAAYIPKLRNPQFQGTYRLHHDIQNPSVVPGEFLLNWPECLSKSFPKIHIGGEGELLKVEISVMGFYIPNVGVGPPLSVITASREENEPIIDPLLMVDIEAVEPRLCFDVS